MDVFEQQLNFTQGNDLLQFNMSLKLGYLNLLYLHNMVMWVFALIAVYLSINCINHLSVNYLNI